MLGYALKRVLLFVPTIFIIAICSFLLQSLTPGDLVEDRLRVDGASIFNSQSSYESAYRDLSRQMALDRPSLYFSIQPSYFPDTLYRIVPKQKRTFLSTLLRQTKDWDKVQGFHHALNHAVVDLESKKGDHKEALTLVNKMNTSKEYADLMVHKEALFHYYQDTNNDVELASIGQLLSSLEHLEIQNGFSWPSFRWHGLNNQFNFWLIRLFSKKNISAVDGKSAVDKITAALKWTVSIGLMSLISVAILSLVLAYLQVYWSGGWFDRISSWVLYFFLAIPTFWFATIMVVFFTTSEYGAWTDIFPSIGIKPSFVDKSFLARLIDNFSQLILPVICITVTAFSYLAIQTRTDLLSAISKPYFLAAKARGLSHAKNLKAHALPNALAPYITIISGAIPSIFTGSVIIEVIFNIPGVGSLMLYSIREQDWSVVFTIVIILSIVTMLGYLIGDLLLMKLYPKTRENFTSSV